MGAEGWRDMENGKAGGWYGSRAKGQTALDM